MGEWANGLLGCFQDPKLSIFTYCAPCYVVGRVAESIGEDGVTWSCLSLVPIVNIFCLAKLREKVRKKRAIEDKSIMDLLLHCCCGCCALVQESREMGAVDAEKVCSKLKNDAEKDVENIVRA